MTDKIVNIEYVNAKNIKTGVRLKNNLPSNGIVKITTIRNSPANFKYESISLKDEVASISKDLSCLKNI